MKKKTWEMPVIKGTLIPFTEAWDYNRPELEYVEPEKVVFDATVRFYGICKGYGSGTKMYLKDMNRNFTNSKGETKPVEYGVFLCDSYEIVMKMDHGIMTGTFEVSKRGQDYGVRLVKAD